MTAFLRSVWRNARCWALERFAAAALRRGDRVAEKFWRTRLERAAGWDDQTQFRAEEDL